MATSKGFAMGFLQLAALIVGLIVGISTLSKESVPVIKKIKENQYQNEIVKKATEQSKMNIQYYYRGNDGTYRYYSDASGYYWTRVNIQGTIEYAQNPNISM